MSHFRSVEECQKNERYPALSHAIFTAGDIDQFEHHRDPTNGSNRPVQEIDLVQNEWIATEVSENLDLELYKKLSATEVDTTFRYLFEKFKKAIFIKIKNNQLSVFLPFSKMKYTNEWGDRIFPPKGKTMSEFLIDASKRQGYSIKNSDITARPDQWYANNCLIRYESPIGENDRGYVNLKDMLETVCANRQVPDIEFFINKRDFPILKKDGTEPYEHMWGSDAYRLVSHRYAKYCPILSMVTSDLHADIPIPTAEDWARVASQDRDNPVIFPGCRSYQYDFSRKWEDRVETAVFRGASTGCGVTIESNPRLMIAKMSMTSPSDGGRKLLDAGITDWNLRPRKCRDSPYLQMIDPARLGLRLVQKLTPVEQTAYKYIVNVDGHVSAFRLCLELSMGSVVLVVSSKYRMWIHRHLVDGVHYLSVKADLSDLYERIRWCRAHDAECRQIAEAARAFYEKYLTKQGVLDYWQAMLCRLKETTSTYFYNAKSADTILREYHLSRLYSSPVSAGSLVAFPFKGRVYHAMDALRRVIEESGVDDVLGTSFSRIYPVTKKASTTILVYPIKGTTKKITVKTSQPERMDEMINEAVCGKGINGLIRQMPHFRYTYCLDRSGRLISEYVEGKTLKEYLTNQKSDKVMQIMMQIAMALAVAQEKIGFVHYDLYPWNVVVQEYSVAQKIVYQFGTHIFQITTKVVPVLIDYGRSHIVDHQYHVGLIDPFKINQYQDVLSLVISIVNEMMVHSLEKERLMDWVNFFAETEFLSKKLTNWEEMKRFVETHAKYNEMIYGQHRYGMIEKDPQEFIFYLLEKDQSAFLTEDFQLVQFEGNRKAPLVVQHYQVTDFYYDLITGAPVTESIVEYLRHIQQVLPSFLDDKADLTFYYGANQVKMYMKGVQYFMETYLVERDDIRALLVDIRKTVDIQPDGIYPFRPGSYSATTGILASRYQPRTFTNPSHILTLLESYLPHSVDFLAYREMAMWTIFYEMPVATQQTTLLKVHRKILELSPLSIIGHNANVFTLRLVSKVLYRLDLAIPNLPEETKSVMRAILMFVG